MKRRYRITTTNKSFGLIFEDESLIEAPAFYYDFIERLANEEKDQTPALYEISVLSGYESKGAEVRLCGTDNEIMESLISTFGLEFESITEYNPDEDEHLNSKGVQ